MYLWRGKKGLNFGSHPPPDPGFFWRILQHRKMGHFFHNLTHISGKTDRIFVNVLSQMCRRTRKTPLHFGSHLEQESESGLELRIRSPNMDQIRLGWGMRSLSLNGGKPGENNRGDHRRGMSKSRLAGWTSLTDVEWITAAKPSHKSDDNVDPARRRRWPVRLDWPDARSPSTKPYGCRQWDSIVPAD